MSDVSENRAYQLSALGAVQNGFLTNVLNPKVTLFLFGVFTQVITATTPFAVRLLYGLEMAFVAFLWFSILSYILTVPFLKDTFMNGMTFSIVGTNLWIIHKNLPDADPESGLGAGNLQGYSTGSLPSTRDISFNIKIQF